MTESALTAPPLSIKATKLATTSRIERIETSAIPNSINTNIINQSVLPPVVPKICSSDVGLSLWNTLEILNAIKPITSAFKTMDMERLVISNMLCQAGAEKWPCTGCRGAALLPATIQMTRNNKLESASG